MAASLHNQTRGSMELRQPEAPTELCGFASLSYPPHNPPAWAEHLLTAAMHVPPPERLLPVVLVPLGLSSPHLCRRLLIRPLPAEGAWRVSKVQAAGSGWRGGGSTSGQAAARGPAPSGPPTRPLVTPPSSVVPNSAASTSRGWVQQAWGAGCVCSGAAKGND